jgi:hypothetical protein
MADRETLFARPVRDVTRRCGHAIWSDPGRLRSRLHYEIGSVTAEQGAVLDALVIAALQGVPLALLDHEDLEPWTLSLSDVVGPLLAAEAISTWARALADLNAPVPEELSLPWLLAKLSPPPPVRIPA